MAARVFYPACHVRIGRYDITPFLGDGGLVSTTKDLYAPKGRWEVVVPDKPLREGEGRGSIVDSLYGLIAPMDRAEIRMARNAYEYPWTRPPVVMRGFVRAVTREESIGEDGRPQRTVRITGDDYGCIGEIVRISLLSQAGLGQSILPVIRLKEMGVEGKLLTACEYISILLKMMNEQLQNMTVETGDIEQIKEIGYDCTVAAGVVHANRLTETQGTAWKLMMDGADTPWNELFIEDRDPALDNNQSGPWLVYRPTPWKTLDGDYITNTGQAVGAGVRHIADQADGGQPEFSLVRSANYQRSDDQVNNIYWVVARAIEFDWSLALANALTNQSGSVHIDHHNADSDIYGPRVLTLESTHAPEGAWRQILVASGQADQNRETLDEWAKQRRKWLVDANIDNVLRDDGTLVVRGNEKLRIGSYYIITRGQFVCEHYLTQISHTFAPGREFFTHVGFIRSNNYYLRNRERTESGRSPFLLEGRAGVLER